MAKMESSEIQLTEILWDVIEWNVSFSEAWDKANYDSFRISELGSGNNLRMSTWCLAQLIPIKVFRVILKSNIKMCCCYFLYFSWIFLTYLINLMNIFVTSPKLNIKKKVFFWVSVVRITKLFQNMLGDKKKFIQAFICLYKHPSDITDYSWFSPLFTVRSLCASNILVCWSLLCPLSLMCISPSIWTYINIKFVYMVVKIIVFTSRRGSAHVLWVNCVIIYVNYVHRSYTLPLGEMQIRTLCSLFVFKYIHFSLQGSGQTPCLFSHCSSFVFSCKYLSL